MKKLLIIVCLFVLTGCSVFVPVKRNFPEVPKELSTKCPDLKLVPDTDKLSEVIVVVTDNYSTYKECQLTVELWNDWYESQKKNFNKVN
jgi:hypothetical protein